MCPKYMALISIQPTPFRGGCLDIPPDVRRQNGIRIAVMIAGKLGIDPNARPADNENFLELVVRQFRNTARFR